LEKVSYANFQTTISMNKKHTHTLAMLAMVFGVALSPILLADNAEAKPADIRHILYGDLTAPNGDKPFGGEMVGDFNIFVTDERISIYATVENRASDGMVLEGWLVDVETGEKLSTGVYKEHSRINGGFTVIDNPGFHYDVFVITEEPRFDTDPTPNKPVAGVLLSAPFGQ